MVHLAYYYKCLALRGLRESLRVLNQDNVDAMLAASYLLSWQASQRFVRLFLFGFALYRKKKSLTLNTARNSCIL
jgi:hypothetical protein